jgi:shikimate kinase
MAAHDVVWLTAAAEHLAAKAVRKSHRPLLDSGDPVELLRHQVAVREPLVLALDPLVIDVSATDDDAAARGGRARTLAPSRVPTHARDGSARGPMSSGPPSSSRR